MTCSRVLILAALLAVLLLGGCERRRASTEPTVTQEQAMEAVYELPEVVDWSARVRRAGAIPECGTRIERDDAGVVTAYVFDMAESRGPGKQLWNRLRVDAVTGKIGVYQPVTDEFLPIDLWRVKIGQE